MKKILLAAFVTLAAFSAQAQSNVTVYGTADAAYEYSNGGNGISGEKKFSGVQSGAWDGSKIGVKGEEVLGNGLKAVFVIEYGVDLDTGTGSNQTYNGSTQARQTYVGLSSNYGAFTLGRQYAPSGMALKKNSAFEVTGTTGLNQFLNSGLAAIGGTMGTEDNARWNNSIAYQSNTYSGFSGRAVYAFGESGTSDIYLATPSTASLSDNGRFGIGGSYANGPFNADLIYQGRYNVTTSYAPWATNQGGSIDEWYFGGGYDFNVVKVVASYQSLSGDKNALQGIGADVWSLGAIVPVSSLDKIRVEYSNINFDQSNSNQRFVNRPHDGTSYGWSLGYTHDLSKRTMLYTNYSYINNDKDSLALGPNGVGSLGDSNYSLVAGIRHNF